MQIYLLSKLHVSDSNVVCSEGDADLPHVGPDVSTDAVLQRLVYNCYKRKTNLIGLSRSRGVIKFDVGLLTLTTPVDFTDQTFSHIR